MSNNGLYGYYLGFRAIILHTFGVQVMVLPKKAPLPYTSRRSLLSQRLVRTVGNLQKKEAVDLTNACKNTLQPKPRAPFQQLNTYSKPTNLELTP